MNPDTARGMGLNPDLPLPQACADFYVLERMEADGHTPASRELERLETSLAREFSRYLDLAVGGELRYALYGGNADSEDFEPEYHCPSLDTHIMCTCGMGCKQACTECWDCCCLCEEPDPGRIGTPAWPDGVNPHLIPTCGTYEDHTPAPCDTNVALMNQPLYDFVTESHCDGRTAAWGEWRRYRERYGVDLLTNGAQVFDKGDWSNGFGGRSWGTVAKLVRDFLIGKVKPRTFIDRCWSLEHNGGCVFDKAYQYEAVKNLMTVLITQAKEDYEELAEKWASPIVGHMWARRRRLRFMQHDPIWLGREHDWFGPDEDWKEAR